ncbi:MAG: 8-amino-7-oxononanoate synthase [Alphaproteobacteria bacterium]|nr:MAG: 8-amino-7-oxononanoate synthase [Alphaproteobacteria bacterium]
MDSLDAYATRKLADIEGRGLLRHLVTTHRGPGGAATQGGRRLISFCCNDYLNLSQNREVIASAQAAAAEYGAGAGGSRLVTGNYPLLAELEDRLARLKGTEAACVFGSGYLANIGIIPCFAGPDDVIFIDELAHACLFAGARMSRAATHVFRHNDMDHLQALLDRQRNRHRHALVITDGVFSMDGDLAPLDIMGPLARAHDAWLLTDDAHGIGVVGRDGRGSSFAFGSEKADVPLQMGTLSKAVGSYGGYLCASEPVIALVRNRARSLVFTTAPPPASIGAALAALDIIERDAELRQAPLAKARLFTDFLGLPDPQSPIVPIIVGAPDRAVEASRKLRDQGFLVNAIRPPSVPEGTARLRVTFMANHGDEDVLRLARAVKALGLSGACVP